MSRVYAQGEALAQISGKFESPQRIKDEAFINDYDSVYAHLLRDQNRHKEVWKVVKGGRFTGYAYTLED